MSSNVHHLISEAEMIGIGVVIGFVLALVISFFRQQ
jgi:hypothetical protein